MWGGSQWSENYQLIDSGFNLILSHVDAWYLDCGFGSWRPTGDGACSPYRTWQTVYKHKPWQSMRLTKQQMKQVNLLFKFLNNFVQLSNKILLFFSQLIDIGWRGRFFCTKQSISSPKFLHIFSFINLFTFRRVCGLNKWMKVH